MAANTQELARYQLADIGARIAALLIDGMLLGFIQGIGFLSARETGLGAGFLFGLVYTWFFLTRNNGQTPGKMVLKIRVIKADGSPISDSDAVIRFVGYYLNSLFMLGWLWALIDENRQGWHDKLVQTYVVKSE